MLYKMLYKKNYLVRPHKCLTKCLTKFFHFVKGLTPNFKGLEVCLTDLTSKKNSVKGILVCTYQNSTKNYSYNTIILSLCLLTVQFGLLVIEN